MAGRDGGNWNLDILSVYVGANRTGVAKLEGYLAFNPFVRHYPDPSHQRDCSDPLGDLGLLFSFVKMERHLQMCWMELCVAAPSPHALNVRWVV